jgi:hypothetical protein
VDPYLGIVEVMAALIARPVRRQQYHLQNGVEKRKGALDGRHGRGAAYVQPGKIAGRIQYFGGNNAGVAPGVGDICVRSSSGARSSMDSEPKSSNQLSFRNSRSCGKVSKSLMN